MHDKQPLIDEINRKKRELTAKLDKLMRPVEEVKDELAALNKTLALFLREDTPVQTQVAASTTSDFPMYRLRDKSQFEAILEIADYYGGIIDTTDVREILVDAKLMRETKNTSQMVNLLITRSGAFERIRRGKYRLIASGQKTRRTTEQFFEAPMPPSKPVQ